MQTIRRVRDAVAEAPGTLPVLAVLLVLVRLTANQGGQPPLVWYPGALILVGVLAVCAAVMPPRLAEQPRAVRVAAALLFGYVVWCALSISWSHDQGAAWDATNQAALYLVIYVLVAGYRQRTATATTILALFALALSAVALIAVLSLTGANGFGHLWGLRAADPTGYPNASAAIFMMAFWPALALASRWELAPLWRGLFAGGATLLIESVLLTESRGALYSLPLVAIAFFVIVPGRVRSLLTLLPVGAAAVATAPHSIHALDRVISGPPRLALETIPGPVLVAAVAVATLVTAAALVERRRPISEELAARGRRLVAQVAAAVLAVALVGGLVAVGDPVARARSAWHSFRHTGDPTAIKHGASRLASGLGSQRYDFYRVALNLFSTHPLVGIGADNYGQEYVQQRRSDETPHFPHSLEFRLLAETGVVGAGLGGGAMVAGLVAAGGAIRRRRERSRELTAVIAGAATIGFVSWLVHGSFDWLWEFPALGGAAWMLLGLAGALAPRGAPQPLWSQATDRPVARPAPTPALVDWEDDRHAWAPAEFRANLYADEGRLPPSATAAPVAAATGRRILRMPPWLAMVTTVVLLAGCAVLAASLVVPWIAQREIALATRVAPIAPDRALADLDRATSLNPIDTRAQLDAASIDIQLGRLGEAATQVGAAIRRDSINPYSWLLQGSILSAEGRRTEALASLGRAAALNPRDTVSQDALVQARHSRLDPVSTLRRVAAEAPQ